MMKLPENEKIAIQFCEDYLNPENNSRYVLGRNVYSESVIQVMRVNGVIDDFSEEREFCGVPIIKMIDLPSDAIVLNASGGRPFTAKTMLDKLGVRNLDYFSFLRHSGMELRDVVFNEGFQEDYREHCKEYDWVLSRLSDAISIELFKKIVGFRNTLDISYLEGFQSNEPAQYFEDFLQLKLEEEIFVDVGCFNGYNSQEFARLVPEFKAIYAFEPDPDNYIKCKNSLKSMRDVFLHNIALANFKGTLQFSPGGSGSKITLDGGVSVSVDRLDDIINADPTLIKMDIEGAECDAILGATETIKRAHPRLAICVYHNVGDFYRIPRLILGIRDDYDIYLRHYTETIYETVMFFIPRKTLK